MVHRDIDEEENRRRMQSGQLHFAFTPDLIADRRSCIISCRKYNVACGEASRRHLVELWKQINCDTSPLPPPPPSSPDSPEEDEDLLKDWPWIDGPIKMDYGYNVRLEKGVYVNSNSVWIDTCLITVGARTLIGPNCSFYSGAHPLDPAVRNGTNGPEYGKPITIGEDCWLGGNCIVLPGVTIGRGTTVGAGSVVTKDVPEFVCVVGNPARIIRTIETSGSPATEGGDIATAVKS